MLLKLITGLSLLLAVLGGVSGNFFLIPVYFIGHFVALFCLAILYCIVICAFVKMDEPAETDSPFYRANMYLYVEFLMNVLRVKVTATGLEKTPKEGRFLLVCNHQHMADPGILLHFFKGSQLAFISKKENEKLPIINKFLHKCLCQSIRGGLHLIAQRNSELTSVSQKTLEIGEVSGSGNNQDLTNASQH